MINRKFVSSPNPFAFSLFVFCSLVFLPKTLAAQTTTSSEMVMVEMQCKPGTAEAWREVFVKEILPSIREAIRKGEAFTNFTYFEAPLPAQDLDFVLLFELKSFSSLDTRRIPPHYEVLFQRLGPDRGEALLREMGDWQEKA